MPSNTSTSSLQEPILSGEKINESLAKNPSTEAPHVSSTPVLPALTGYQEAHYKTPLRGSPVASHWPPCLRDNSLLSQCSKNSTGLFCRICHDGEGEERLISPCHCSGSVGLLHRTCIEKWLSSVNKDTCELCHQKFRVSRHSRPFSSWLLTPAVGDDQRNLMGDLVCFMLLTPLTTISAYLCASGASYYLHQIKKSEAVGLLALASILVFIYLIWLLLTIRYHFQVWFKWRSNNQDIRLLDVSNNMPVTTRKSPKILRQSIQNRILNQQGLVDYDFTNEAVETSQTSLPHLEDPVEVVVDRREEIRRPPLTPIIISQDPQRDSVSKVIKNTKDSVVYAQVIRTNQEDLRQKALVSTSITDL